VSVPHPSNSNNHHRRQRQESSSSVSVGSWQMISGTGSLRSQDSNILVVNEQQQPNLCNSLMNNNNNVNNSSTNVCSNQGKTVNRSSDITIVDDDCFTANDYFMRRERLDSFSFAKKNKKLILFQVLFFL
jgi:hypothetical protein